MAEVLIGAAIVSLDEYTLVYTLLVFSGKIDMWYVVSRSLD